MFHNIWMNFNDHMVVSLEWWCMQREIIPKWPYDTSFFWGEWFLVIQWGLYIYIKLHMLTYPINSENYLYLSLYKYIYISISISIYLYISISISISISIYIYIYINLYVYIYLYIYISISISISICLSIYLSISISIYIYILIYIYIYIYIYAEVVHTPPAFSLVHVPSVFILVHHIARRAAMLRANEGGFELTLVSMGISTNQKRIYFSAGYLRLAMNWALVQMPEFDAWERHVTILCRALNATLLHVCGAVSAAPGTGKSQGMARAFVNGRAELQFDTVMAIY